MGRHAVLIPGFAGFDALGQLEYYAGVTPLFRERAGATLHYFDNLPTAGVRTRAARLARFLAKRRARGEIGRGDEVALIGHSTGGLDIRRLLCDLDTRAEAFTVDGGVEVAPRDILDSIRRVVFLSVPHCGTNIADWVRSYPVSRRAVVIQLRVAVAGAQAPIAGEVEDGAVGAVALLSGAGLFRAVQDSLREADPRFGGRGPLRAADAHEAAAALDLYLRHIASDFAAIDDLSANPHGDSASPAHFTPRQRKEELRLWARQGIVAHSYVTVGPRPFAFEFGRPAPVWQLAAPWTYPELTPAPPDRPRTDLVYRVCYRACAGGPFAASVSGVETWDNDGIVNTASMFWPEGEHRVVVADHMDIVGHFANVAAPRGGGRRSAAYDLLGSGSGLAASGFAAIWNEILDWATGPRAMAAAP